MDLERPESACRTCRPPKTDAWTLAEHGWRVCDRCFDRLEDMLSEINRRFFLLDPRPGRGRLDSRGSPGFGSRSPANETVIAMRDPGSGTTAKVWLAADGRVHREDENPPRGVFNELLTYAVDVCERRGFERHGCASVPELCVWLAKHLDWMVRQDSIVEFHTAMARLVRQLRPVTGERRIGIGKCGECGARLYAPTQVTVDPALGIVAYCDVIFCSGCEAQWQRSDWLNLGDELAET